MPELSTIRENARAVAEELIQTAALGAGSVVVVGCSSSEIAGQNVGSASSPEIGRAVYEEISAVFRARGIFLAAQCCEHLNRALILERAASGGYEIVNTVPQPKAGGSFASAAYELMEDPVAVEEIRADAGLDIGGTLIGMHLKKVAVPLRLSATRVGDAPVNAARTRPKFVGGDRAVYDERLR